MTRYYPKLALTQLMATIISIIENRKPSEHESTLIASTQDKHFYSFQYSPFSYVYIMTIVWQFRQLHWAGIR